MFSLFKTRNRDIGLMGIISKHVVYELLIAVKNGLQAKSDFMTHAMFVKGREGLVKGIHMFGSGNLKKLIVHLLLLLRMYSAFSKVLELILTHHQYTRTCTP